MTFLNDMRLGGLKTNNWGTLMVPRWGQDGQVPKSFGRVCGAL